MNNYLTGATIKNLRKKKNLTQIELANLIGVSPQAVSKWETGKGLPDISLIEPLGVTLGVSTLELMLGNTITNKNLSSNLLRSKFYVCPICGNVIYTVGEAVVSCCGILLPSITAEESDENHKIRIERVEDENFISINHDMTKSHYISFLAYVTSNKIELVKLYPEGNAETRFKICGSGCIYYYCNKHGLFKIKI